MKKKIIVNLLLFLFSGITVFSQTYVFQAKQKGSKKWGYANIKGEMIIEPQYKVSTKFSEEGYAMVHKGKYLIINLKGELIPMEVDKVRPVLDFYATTNGYGIHAVLDGLLVTKNEGKLGCIGPDGKIAIPIKYDRLTDFKSGYVIH